MRRIPIPTVLRQRAPPTCMARRRFKTRSSRPRNERRGIQQGRRDQPRSQLNRPPPSSPPCPPPARAHRARARVRCNGRRRHAINGRRAVLKYGGGCLRGNVRRCRAVFAPLARAAGPAEQPRPGVRAGDGLPRCGGERHRGGRRRGVTADASATVEGAASRSRRLPAAMSIAYYYTAATPPTRQNALQEVHVQVMDPGTLPTHSCDRAAS